MRAYPVRDISPDSFFTRPVYLDNGFLIASPEMPFTGEMIDTLQAWEFTEVFSQGEPREGYSAAAGERPDEGGVSDATLLSDSDKIHKAEEFYRDFQKYTELLFTRAAVKEELDFASVAEKIKLACNAIKEDQRYLLRVQRETDAPEGENYLSAHTVRSTIIAIIIGNYLKLPNHRIIELGVAALLHEIGMRKLPSQVYLAKRALNPQEQKLIYTHPILGYNLLKAAGFPLGVSLAALEHHERENGSGYPRKLSGDKISLYSKIIAVACTYEALSGKRPHKEALDASRVMLELLRNEGKQFDDTVVRALVFSLSIYPIGLHVLLSNGRKGQVVDVIPERPKHPIVQVFGELTPDGKNKIVSTSPELYIVRPLKREEAGV